MEYMLRYKDGSGCFQKYDTLEEANEAIASIGAEDRIEAVPYDYSRFNAKELTPDANLQ